ncbi:MAG: hypothetical protein ACE5JU_08620 [Candidatus Binatia bacterium]
MNCESVGPAVLRIELCHGLLVLTLLLLLVPAEVVEPGALLLGGLFMAVNFWLLSYGIRWVLTPFAGKGRVRAGVVLLGVKLVLFLGVVSLVFFRVHLDPASFGVGVSCLLGAIVFEAVRSHEALGGAGE